MRAIQSLVAAGLSMILVLGAGATALAQPDEEAVATISEADGNVTICSVGEECRPAESGDRIFEGTRIRTAASSGRIEVREVPRAEFGEGNQPVILTLADETELWFVPEGYAGENLPEEGVFEVLQGWVRAAVRGRKLSNADLAIRKLGRFWQSGTSASCGPKGTDYVVSYDPETGITTVTVGEGAVVCATPDGDERVIDALHRIELRPDGFGPVVDMTSEDWARRSSRFRYPGWGFVQFVGEATHIYEAKDTGGKTCTGKVPIYVSVAWTPDVTSVQVGYYQFNIVGLPQGLIEAVAADPDSEPGSSIQYLDCLQGGGRGSHKGQFDRSTGAVNRLEDADLAEIDLDWDPSNSTVSSVRGSLVASDGLASWNVTFALAGPCSGGYSRNDFDAANAVPAERRLTLYEPPVRSTSGVIVTGCTLDLVSPPDGPLELSLEDLPLWAQDQLLTLGAVGWACSDPPLRVTDGDPLVLVDGLPVARLGDPLDGDVAISAGSTTILVNGQPAAVVPAC